MEARRLEYDPSSTPKMHKIGNLNPKRSFVFFRRRIPSLFIAIVAISVALTRTAHLSHLFRKVSSSYPFILFKIANRNPSILNLSKAGSPCLLWMAPFLSGGGYSSEAWSYILALNRTSRNPFRMSIAQHGDALSYEFWQGLSDEEKKLALRLHQEQCLPNETIVVCHSEPGAWRPPLFETPPCPPLGYDGYLSVIGRTMFETDRLTAEHVARCNRMDYVWVPSDFHVSTFVNSGVDSSKVVKVVQAVDVDFFDPEKHKPLQLQGNLIMGEVRKGAFVFLSIFKWEYRKGWDVLLKAYLSEFSADDGVSLLMLTSPYHTAGGFGNRISEFVEKSAVPRPEKGWPAVSVVDAHIAQVDLPGVYRCADAFVLPSRGEGWGRPLVEAMAMSVPVIATNWSGPTEFLREENGYPVRVEKMVEVREGPFRGHLWAEPSVGDLRGVMRRVVEKREESKKKGMLGRQHMIQTFSPEIVAETLLQRLRFVAHNSASSVHSIHI